MTSKTENALVNMFETRFKLIRKANKMTPPFDMSKHSLLFGFDTDVVFTEREQTGDNNKRRIINIEIDGPHHIYTHRKRFAMLRDKYLRDIHGVEIVRIPIPKQQDWSEKAMKDMVHAQLRDCGIIPDIDSDRNGKIKKE